MINDEWCNDVETSSTVFKMVLTSFSLTFMIQKKIRAYGKRFHWEDPAKTYLLYS